MTKKRNILIAIGVAIAATLLTAVFIFINNIRPKEIPPHLMTYAKALENGAYATMSMQPIESMEQFLSSATDMVEVTFISESVYTSYADHLGNTLETKPEEELFDNGKLRYHTLKNPVWRVRVEEVIFGNLTEGQEIDIMFGILGAKNLPTIDDNKPIIFALDKGVDDVKDYYFTGISSAFYLENGYVFPAYDVPDIRKSTQFFTEYVGITQKEFVKKLKSILPEKFAAE